MEAILRDNLKKAERFIDLKQDDSAVAPLEQILTAPDGTEIRELKTAYLHRENDRSRHNHTSPYTCPCVTISTPAMTHLTKTCSVISILSFHRHFDMIAGDIASLSALLTTLRPFFAQIPKAKTGKLIRLVIEDLQKIPDSGPTIVSLCKDLIEWADTEVLRHSLESTLAQAYYDSGDYNNALEVLSKLIKEVKRLDDKRLLVSIFLLESRAHHALRHLPRSRASLTASRTAANSIYCPPSLQAQLDTHSGTLHAEEKDYKTAYSYFYEAYENFEALTSEDHSHESTLCLKYMLLTRIMAGNADDVNALLSGKLALKYTDNALEAMVAIARAHRDASLRAFKDAIEKYQEELHKDPVIDRHLKQLYQNLMEDNLLRIVLPFSLVEIERVAELIELDREIVERKLSQMILDKKLSGILDQASGCLAIFESPVSDPAYTAALDAIDSLGEVVDSLYNRASKLR